VRPVEASSAPANREAFALYLRSIVDGARWETGNKEAIAVLERAWDLIRITPRHGRRWDGGITSTRFIRAAERRGISALEPAYKRPLRWNRDRVSAAGLLANNEVVGGNLDKAYGDAQALVQKRTDAAFAHFSLAYVLRYAGRLDEAQSECDKALAIDSGDFNWRTCSLAFAEAGKQSRAIEYLNRDAGSEWSNAVRVSVLMRQGKMAEAKLAAQQMTENPTWMRGLVEACLNKAPPAKIHRLAEQAENDLLPRQDPELKYQQGTILAACGEKQIAYKFLSQAVAGNYCAHQALQSDPLLASVRGDAQFRQIVQTAAECQRKFEVAQGMSK
jgi:hypothetical protein